MSVDDQSIGYVDDFRYLFSIMASSLNDLKRSRGMHGPIFGSLKTSVDQTVTITIKLRLFDSLIISIFFYGSDLWSVNQTMIYLINSFATSAYRIMTGVKWLNKVHNTTVLASVSWQHLIRTLQARQLKFLGHLIRSENSTCCLPTTTWQHPTRMTSHQLHP